MGLAEVTTPTSHFVSSSQPRSYEFRLGNAALDAQSALNVWRNGGLGSALNDAANQARYAWFYINNPLGQALLAFLQLDQKPIGCLGVGQWQFIIDGNSITAGMLVDFVIDPRHRSAFPALMLQRRGREAAQKSMQMLFGMPGSRSETVFRRLGSQLRIDLPRFVRVLQSRTYLERLLPPWIARPLAILLNALDSLMLRVMHATPKHVGQWDNEFHEDFDQLWNTLNKRDLCVGKRDRSFLQWRFAQQPNRQYSTFCISRKEDGALRAYFVCEQIGSTMMVRDCLWLGDAAELRAGLLLLITTIRQLGLSALEIEISVNDEIRRCLKQLHFSHRSSRSFHIIMSDALVAKATNLHWHITPADEDG